MNPTCQCGNETTRCVTCGEPRCVACDPYLSEDCGGQGTEPRS